MDGFRVEKFEESKDGRRAVEARDLWLSYDASSYALQEVDLSLEQGAITMVLGRSGSGKTTLLKVLAGLLHPQRGWVRYGDGVAGNGNSRYRAVAYIPQTLGLVRSLTALENTLVGALGRTGTLPSLFKIFPKATIKEALATLSSLGIGHKVNEKVYNLSGGERQRVAIARALMQRPSIILADEFVSQLDPVTAEDILRMMRTIASQGVSLLVTTHETDIVAKYADWVVVVREGRTLHYGPATDLTERNMLELLQ